MPPKDLLPIIGTGDGRIFIIDKDANESEGALVLTSHSNARGLNTHIEKYALINRSGAFAKLNGYKKTLQYFENEIQDLIRKEHGPKAEEIIWNLLPARTAIFRKTK